MCLSLCSFSSGSNGNCVFVSSNEVGMLIDAGISLKRLEKYLNDLEIRHKSIKGILITHSHLDHIFGIKNIIKKYNLDIYTHEPCAKVLSEKYVIDIKKIKIFNGVFFLGDVMITPFSVSHDVPTVGFAFEKNNIKLGYVTDIGHINKKIENIIIGSNLLFIESNHDIEMVQKNVKYSQALKTRILSPKGHLSNDDCAFFVKNSIQAGTQQIVLGHLSENNNNPKLAFETVKNYLQENNIYYGKHYNMEVALRSDVSNWFVAD